MNDSKNKNIGIYSITNNINNKRYIGQSTNITRRWKDHRNSYKWVDESHLYRAFRKYGLEEFTFEVLENTSVELLNEREIYYINLFDTFNNGYNLTEGGSNVSTFKLSKEDVEDISDILRSSNRTYQNIADEYNVSIGLISEINNGNSHVRDIDYPIRPFVREPKKVYLCLDCGKEIYKSSERCFECYHLSIRKVKERPSPEWLIKNIAERGFVDVGKEFGVSDNAVKKWCKAYGLPHLKKDIVKLYKTSHLSSEVEQ